MNLQRMGNVQQASQATTLEASRAEALAMVLSRAFQHEPNLVHIVPDKEARRVLLPSFFLSVIHAGLLYGEILTTQNADAVAVWIRPHRDLPFRQMLGTGLIEFPFNPGSEYARRYMTLSTSVAEVRKRLAPSPHWYLMILGMETSTKERTVGDALIDPVLSQADSTGTPCYLETFSEKDLGFYKDFGFRITGAGRIPDGGPSFWTMTRLARPDPEYVSRILLSGIRS